MNKAGQQLVSVIAFIPWQNKVLVAKRSKHDDFLPGYWELIGGGLDFGEDPYEGLVREVKEESNLTVKPERPYFIASYIDADGSQALEIAFYCAHEGAPEVTLSHEHEAMRWITKDELEQISPISGFMRTMILEGFNALDL